jgi:hypothetical protein
MRAVAKKDAKKRSVLAGGTLDRMPPAAVPAGGFGASGLVAKLTGARLCYGKPVRQGDFAVVPVASVRAVGGYGVGRPGANGAGDSGQEGGGGGGSLTGRPLGYIEIGPDGTRFQPIATGLRGRGPALALGAGAGAVAGAGLVATGVGGFVAGRRFSALLGLAFRPWRLLGLRRRGRAALPSPRRWPAR